MLRIQQILTAYFGAIIQLNQRVPICTVPMDRDPFGSHISMVGIGNFSALVDLGLASHGALKRTLIEEASYHRHHDWRWVTHSGPPNHKVDDQGVMVADRGRR